MSDSLWQGSGIVRKGTGLHKDSREDDFSIEDTICHRLDREISKWVKHPPSFNLILAEPQHESLRHQESPKTGRRGRNISDLYPNLVNSKVFLWGRRGGVVQSLVQLEAWLSYREVLHLTCLFKHNGRLASRDGKYA